MAINYLKGLLSKDRKLYFLLYDMLGIAPNNIDLYRLALRHSSAAKFVHNGIKNSNERLEFLGDAVLGLVVGKLIYKRYPFKDEGFLTEVRSKVVNRNHLNTLAQSMGIAQFIEFDERNHSLRDRSNIDMYGDAFEALIGAIYLDKGYKFTSKFILNKVLKEHIDLNALVQTETNFKSRLYEWCQRNNKKLHFDCEVQDNRKTKRYIVWAVIDGEAYDKAEDASKKNAEKTASELAYKAVAANSGIEEN